MYPSDFSSFFSLCLSCPVSSRFRRTGGGRLGRDDESLPHPCAMGQGKSLDLFGTESSMVDQETSVEVRLNPSPQIPYIPPSNCTRRRDFFRGLQYLAPLGSRSFKISLLQDPAPSGSRTVTMWRISSVHPFGERAYDSTKMKENYDNNLILCRNVI